jgi:pectate lyase
MRRVLAAAALAIAPSIAPSIARADDGDEPAPAPVPAPAPAPAPAPSAPAEQAGGLVARIGVLGAYRSLYDLSIFGGGVALSLGGEGRHAGGHFGVYFVDARTAGGLAVLEGGVRGTAEWRLGGGWRWGVGGGITAFGVRRATNGNFIESNGLDGILRVGYDFGAAAPGAQAPERDRVGAYVLGDLDTLFLAGAFVWGPTLQLGLRF